jgi:hypothetical protein
MELVVLQPVSEVRTKELRLSRLQMPPLWRATVKEMALKSWVRIPLLYIVAAGA